MSKLFQDTFQPIDINDIHCNVDDAHVSPAIHDRLHQIKNTLKLTHGYTPNPPIIRFTGRSVTAQECYIIYYGHLTVKAAQLLQQEYPKCNKLYCLVLTQLELNIFDTLQYLTVLIIIPCFPGVREPLIFKPLILTLLASISIT